MPPLKKRIYVILDVNDLHRHVTTDSFVVRRETLMNSSVTIREFFGSLVDDALLEANSDLRMAPFDRDNTSRAVRQKVVDNERRVLYGEANRVIDFQDE
jgi:hypothetical protein